MKLLFGTLILGGAASVFAQDTPPTPAAPAKPARVAIMTATGSDVIVAGVTKNAPFMADESGETVRIMADGNRIVESWTGKTARNSEGRVRREVNSGNVGSGSRPLILDGAGPGPAVFTVGAGDGATSVFRAKIESEAAGGGARTIVVSPSNGEGYSVSTAGGGDEAKRVSPARIEASAAREGTWVASGGIVPVAAETGVLSVGAFRRVEEGKSTTRKEDLGTREFFGVQAEGHRVITTYAAGAFGNEREIEVTSEVWFSKDLNVIVYSKRSDPRTGETTYQMTNIVRAEPDASLFQIRGK